jgi:predicted RNA polymerase sigma factor
MKYSLHRQTAKAHLERHDVTIRSEVPSLAPEQVQAAGQLYEAGGLSLAQVAKRFEVAPNTLRRAIGRAGFRIRARGYAGPRPT